MQKPYSTQLRTDGVYAQYVLFAAVLVYCQHQDVDYPQYAVLTSVDGFAVSVTSIVGIFRYYRYSKCYSVHRVWFCSQ